MTPENENEHPIPSLQDSTAASEVPFVGAEGSVTEEGARPGVTDVQAYIGRQLRAVYDDVVKQPIPDRFLALMKQLEEQTPQG